MRYQIVKRFGEAGFAIVNGKQVYFSNESELRSLASNAPTTFAEKPKTEMSMEDQIIDVEKHIQNKENGYVKISMRNIWLQANKLVTEYTGLGVHRKLCTKVPRVEKVNAETCDVKISYEWCEKPGDNKISITAEESRKDYKEYNHLTFLADITIYVKVENGCNALDLYGHYVKKTILELCKEEDLSKIRETNDRYIIDNSKIKTWICDEYDYLFKTYQYSDINIALSIKEIMVDACCYAINKVDFNIKENRYHGDDDDDPFNILAKDR